jgi:hypothetical protein
MRQRDVPLVSFVEGPKPLFLHMRFWLVFLGVCGLMKVSMAMAGLNRRLRRARFGGNADVVSIAGNTAYQTGLVFFDFVNGESARFLRTTSPFCPW